MKKILLIGTSPAMLLEAILLSKKYRNIEIHEKVILWAAHGKLEIFLKLKTLKLVAIFLLLGETDLYIISAKIF